MRKEVVRSVALGGVTRCWHWWNHWSVARVASLARLWFQVHCNQQLLGAAVLYWYKQLSTENLNSQAFLKKEPPCWIDWRLTLATVGDSLIIFEVRTLFCTHTSDCQKRMYLFGRNSLLPVPVVSCCSTTDHEIRNTELCSHTGTVSICRISQNRMI